ncbi:MAG TPA: HEPN domain-containing protein [Bryobacteraceae bacterium]|nr:HEPN domain-containing protein [Bryobacteraceae bacterium]
MHHAKSESYWLRIQELASVLTGPLGIRDKRRFILIDTACALLDDHADKYVSLVQELLRTEQWERKFTRHFVSSRLGKVLVMQATGDSAQAKLMWADLIGEVEAFDLKFTVYIPVSGLDLKVPVLRLAGVDFISISDTLRSEFKSTFAFAAEKELEQMSRVWASCVAVAEPTRAFEFAEQRVRRALDLFRYAMLIGSKRQQPLRRLGVSLQGEMIQSTRTSLAACSTPHRNTYRTVALGPRQGLLVDEETIHVFSEIGLYEIAELLEREAGGLSDFEAALLRAVHWLANAQTQIEPESELLSLSTGLEALFTRADGSPITSTLAEGIAFVLGGDLKSRLAIKKRVSALYGRRSAVSHGGRTAVDETELSELTDIASNVVRQLCLRRCEFQTRAQLHDWIEKMKMA